MTVRSEITVRLQQRKMTVRELAIEFRMMTKDVAIELRHIGRSIYPRYALKMEIPVCRNCGYAFKERSKLKPPSRCPQCKGEKITEPKFWIEQGIIRKEMR